MRSALMKEVGVLGKGIPEKSFLLSLHTERYTKKCLQPKDKKKAYSRT